MKYFVLVFIIGIIFPFYMFAQPSTITYQGVLTDDAGALINGARNLIFEVYDASSGGNLLATDTHNETSITNGLFNVELSLGSINFSQNLWLEITVESTVLTPRVAFNASGYALASPNYGMDNFTGSYYLYDTKAGVKLTPNNAAANVDFVLQPKGTGAIIAQQPDGTTTGGNKRGNYAVDMQMKRDQQTHVASGEYSTIGGGESNASSGTKSIVSGGSTNIASGQLSTVGGGERNNASSDYSTVGGGERNNASSDYSTVGGGESNSASGIMSIVGGGSTNIASGQLSTVDGGASNSASGYASTVGGGLANCATGVFSTAGGYYNAAQSYAETVLGLFAIKGGGNADSRVATDHLFVVGNGTADDLRSNALTILKNANTTIGGSLTINSNGINSSVTFPTNRGTSGQVLTTDGSGVTSWAGIVTSVSGTAPLSVATGTSTPVISIAAATTSAAGSMSATDKTKLDRLMQNVTQAQRDLLSPSEGMVIYNSTTHKPNYYNGTEWLNFDGTSAKTLAVGVSYQGGVIAYLFQPVDPGYVDGEIHGLIAAPSDQSTGATWYNERSITTNATATAIGTGSANTSTIIAVQGDGIYAAKLCADLVLGGYDDWYLPSKDELNKLYISKVAIGGFNNGLYWSSTEYNASYSYYQVFNNGYTDKVSKEFVSVRVRAVRSF